MATPEALFTAHHAGLVRYLRRVVGHADAARDLAQDVFVRAIRADVRPGTDEECRAWLFRIARNLAIDYRRRQQTRPAGAPPAEGALTSSATQETSAAVGQALASLDDIDRDVLLMREVVGLSYQEIAAACDLSPDAVRSRLHRTRLDLRTRLSRPIAQARERPLRIRPTNE